MFAPPGFNVARLTAHYENWATVLNSLGICFRMQSSALHDLRTCAELYSAATGLEKAPSELLKDAERAYNIYKAANVREGFDRKDDKFPEKWFEPLKRKDTSEELILTDYFGTAKLTKANVEKLLDDYYEEKGWDVKRGIPKKEKLIELGLEDVAKELEKYR